MIYTMCSVLDWTSWPYSYQRKSRRKQNKVALQEKPTVLSDFNGKNAVQFCLYLEAWSCRVCSSSSIKEAEWSRNPLKLFDLFKMSVKNNLGWLDGWARSPRWHLSDLGAVPVCVCMLGQFERPAFQCWHWKTHIPLSQAWCCTAFMMTLLPFSISDFSNPQP